MTTVVGLDNMPSSTTDVAVAFLDQSKLALKQGPEVLADGSIRAIYIYTDGDPTVNTTVSALVRNDEKKNVVRTSIQLSTIQTVTVDSVVTETAPISATLTVEAPGQMEDSTKVLAMLGTLYSLWFNGVTSKVPNTGTIAKLNKSIVGSLYG